MFPILASFCIALTLLIFSHITLAFIFWSSYLLHAILHKRACYKSALRSVERDSDTIQVRIVFNIRTEYVKYVYMFVINIVEWVSAVLFITACLYNVIVSGIACEITELYNSTEDTNRSNNCFLIQLQINNLNSIAISVLLTIWFCCFVISFGLVTNLCRYLSSRYALKSWIKNDRILLKICSTAILVITFQLLAFICDLTLIAWSLKIVIEFIMLWIGYQQYKKLMMVINWNLVDLGISKVYPRVIPRLVRNKKRFSRFFITFTLGAFLLVTTEFLNLVLEALQLILDNIHTPGFTLCTISSDHIPYTVTVIATVLSCILGGLGATFILVPYVFYAFAAFLVCVRNRITGKTRYITHYSSHLDMPLIAKYTY